jgi:hypothetical protein
MALFPSMSTLVTVDLDCGFGTHYRANGTAGAFFGIVEGSDPVAAGIQFIRTGDRALWAEEDAYLASLAELPVDLYLTLHSNLSKKIETSNYNVIV